MKNLIYTSIYGDYDDLNLLNEIIVDDNYEYICISDKTLNVPIPWKLLILKNNFSENKIMNRWTKFCIHLILPNYRNCIYHDGNIILKEHPSFFFNKLNEINKIIFLEHPIRKNILSETIECVLMKYFDFKTGLKFLFRTSLNGYKDNHGLTNNRLLIRNMQDQYVNQTFEKIFMRYLNGPKRDQLHSIIEISNSGIEFYLIKKELINKLIEIYPHIINLGLSKKSRILRRLLYTFPLYFIFKISFFMGEILYKYNKWVLKYIKSKNF